MPRFCFVVLLLSNLQFLPSSTQITCPYIPDKNDWQNECQAMMSDYQEGCDDYPNNERAVFFKEPRLRAQVVCHFVDTESFREMAEGVKTSFDERVFVESAKVKELLKRDMKERLSRLAREEVQDEIDLMRVSSQEKIERFKSLLARMEQSYLMTITSILQRFAGKTTAPEPPTTPKSKPTSYQPLPSTEHENMYDTIWYRSAALTSSPLFYRHLKFEDGKWVFSEGTPSISSSPLTTPFPRWRDEEFRFKLSLRQPYSMWKFKPLKKLPKMQTEESVDKKFVLLIMFNNCWTVPEMTSSKWAFLSYLNVVFQLNSKGWLTLTYESTGHQAGLVRDPLQDDLTGSIVVVISAMGSKARVSDCKNEVPGPGIYRMFENGTCFGMPIFSKKAAQVDKYCCDKMMPGWQISNLMVNLYMQYDFNQVRDTDYSVVTFGPNDPYDDWLDGSHADDFKPFVKPLDWMGKDEVSLKGMLKKEKMPIYELHDVSPKKRKIG